MKASFINNRSTTCRIWLLPVHILEDLDVKKSVYAEIEDVVAKDTLLTSTTSAIPLASYKKKPDIRKDFSACIWLEPSHTTRFLEIICGDLRDNYKILKETLYQRVGRE